MEETRQNSQALNRGPAAPEIAASQRRLFVFGMAAAAVGGYFWWDTKRRREQRAAEELARKAAEDAELKQRQAQEQAEGRQRWQRTAEEIRAKAEQRRVQEEQRRASMFPVEIRRERIEAQFSGWDGSHRATEQAIKARMNNPDSYDHVQTVYVDHGPGKGLRVTTRFRGTNAFSAVVLNTAVAEVSESGVVTSVNLAR